MGSFIVNIVILVLVLGILITLHELGHFVAAKLSKVKVESFGIGMGPTIFKKLYKGTEYKLSILPIGGYVNILGEVVDEEEMTDEIKNNPDSFQSKGLLTKVFILSAGVLMNFFTAVVIYYLFLVSGGFSFSYPTEVTDYKPVFGEVKTEITGDLVYTDLVEDGNALKNEWPKKGHIKSIGESSEDLQPVITSIEFSEFVRENKEKEVFVEICEVKTKDDCNVYSSKVSKEGYVGIIISSNVDKYVEYQGGERVFAGFVHSANMIHLAGVHIGNIFSEASDTGDYSTAVNTFSGPVGLYFIIDFLKQMGILGIADLVANLSLTLFVMNLLPIPALDGGRIVLAIVEKAMGKKFNKNIEAWLVRGSFILLMIFMLVVFLKDIVFIKFLKDLF